MYMYIFSAFVHAFCGWVYACMPAHAHVCTPRFCMLHAYLRICYRVYTYPYMLAAELANNDSQDSGFNNLMHQLVGAHRACVCTQGKTHAS